MTLGLYEGFKDYLMPMVLEVGTLFFAWACIGGAYILMRGMASESIKKIKMATIGYTALKFIILYITYIDKIINKLLITMSK